MKKYCSKRLYIFFPSVYAVFMKLRQLFALHLNFDRHGSMYTKKVINCIFYNINIKNSSLDQLILSCLFEFKDIILSLEHTFWPDSLEDNHKTWYIK